MASCRGMAYCNAIRRDLAPRVHREDVWGSRLDAMEGLGLDYLRRWGPVGLLEKAAEGIRRAEEAPAVPAPTQADIAAWQRRSPQA